MSTFVEYFDTIADLQSYVPGAETVIVTDQNRGGTFVYDHSITSSGLSTEGILTYKSTAVSYGWRRLIDDADAVNVLWSGAKGDAVTTNAVIAGTGAATTVTVSSGSFDSIRDAGKAVTVAGGALVSGQYIDLATTISTVVSPTVIKLTTAPVFLPIPTGPTNVQTSGGALPAGSYSYYIVAVTLFSNSLPTTVLNVTNAASKTNTLSWGAVTGALSYKVYRNNGIDPTVYYLVQGTSFADAGGAPTGTEPVPTTNAIINYGTDDTSNIQKVLDLASNVTYARYNILFPTGKIFKITAGLTSNYSARIINAYGSTVIRNNTHRILTFTGQEETGIYGGTWAALFPISNLTGEEACFKFADCKKITVADTHINGSPETGVTLEHVVFADIRNNLIENCFRDGIYADYSGFLNYTSNTLRNIKDDAMSIHDYGNPGLRTMLNSVGLTQAGQSIVSGNIVQFAYQGFGSVGGDSISIYGNEFSNTVNCAVSLFNPGNTSAPYENYISSGTRVRKMNIVDNICRDNCKNTTIMNVPYQVSVLNQQSNAVAAISVESQDAGYLYASADPLFKSSNINIENNKIYDCGTNAVMAHQIDGVTISNNYAYNSNSLSSSVSNIGLTFLVINCTKATILKNTALDDRGTPLQIKAYSIQNTEGYMDLWYADKWSSDAAGEVKGTTQINVYTPDTWKKVVRLASTGNVATLSGTSVSIDSLTVAANDLVLLKNQTTASQNGIYLVKTGAWTRMLDASIGAQIHPATIFVTAGTTQANTQWVCTNNTIPVVGTDPINFGAMLKLGYTPVNSTSTTVGLFLNQSSGMVEAGLTTLVRVSQDYVGISINQNVVAFTVPGVGAADYLISGYLNVVSLSSKTAAMQVVFTDQNNTVRTIQFYNMGSTTPTLSAVGVSSFPTIFLRAKAGTTITIQAVLTGAGTLVYDTGGRITEI